MSAQDSVVSARQRLARREVAALKAWAQGGKGRLTAAEDQALRRLVEPIESAAVMWPSKQTAWARTAILSTVHRVRKPYVVWDQDTWLQAANAPNGVDVGKSHPARLGVVALGHVLGGQHRLHAAAAVRRLRKVADRVFGTAELAAAVGQVTDLLAQWKISTPVMEAEAVPTLLDLLLTAASTDLRCITEEHLHLVIADTHAATARRRGVLKVSRVLSHLGIIKEPWTNCMASRGVKQPTLDSVPAQWLSWAQRWRSYCTREPSTTRHMFTLILIAGRWAAERCPIAVSPEQWTRDVAAAYVADTVQAPKGRWAAGTNPNKTGWGDPLGAAGISNRLDTIRSFFNDLIEWEWIPARFDPRRVLAIPKPVRARLAFNPRLIDDATWAKLMAAGLTLNMEDLARTGPPREGARHQTRYPIEMMRALVGVWLFAGLRIDEIRRLEPDCVMWQQMTDRDTGEQFTACLLRIPQNKTSPPFTKPVDPIVGQLIEAWLLVRGAQQLLIDRKTGHRREFLFCYYGQLIGYTYLNERLIPALCRKAGVPQRDSRGALTSHRARATIATQLLNAREPLTLPDLQAWLGHINPNSTRHYAKILRRTLTAAYRKADYFARNVRTIQVLIDRDSIMSGAAANGAPWKYYDLGPGYCTYDFFATCPHRMACARCPFYLPKKDSSGQLLATSTSIDHLLENLELTDDERAALEGDKDAINTLTTRLADTPTPGGPTPRQLGGSPAFISITDLHATIPKQSKEVRARKNPQVHQGT